MPWPRRTVSEKDGGVECTAAAQKLAKALEEMGHSIEAVELPTISEDLVDPFNLMVAASLGEHLDEVDFDKVEPHTVVARTDLPGASWETLVDSIRLLADRFPPETTIYSGHGPETTLGAELARNPFLAELRA